MSLDNKEDKKNYMHCYKCDKILSDSCDVCVDCVFKIKMEVDFLPIISEKFNFLLGNVIKYLWRSDHKGRRLNDLKKAKWYLEREICLEEEKSKSKDCGSKV